MTIHARNSRRTSARIPQALSPIAETFAVQIRAEKLPRPIREYRPCSTRRWRLDFAYPDMRLAIEIDGEVHRIKARFHADLEKHAWLVLNGWTLLRVGGREVRSGTGVTWLQSLLWERCPLGLSRAYTSGETRDPAPDVPPADTAAVPPCGPCGTNLWISPSNDAPGGLEPSLG